MSDSDKRLKVVGFHAENVKRVKLVDLEITGENGLVIIGGKNEQGKSSVLDSLMYALGGAKSVPPMPIHEGAEKGEVSVILKGESAEYIVRRTFTEKKSYLSVETADGATFKSPQAMLDGFIGELSFDPLAFGNLPPTEQREVILDLSGMRDELEENERKIQEAYEERRDIGRDGKTLKAKLNGEDMPDGPDQEVDQSEILQKLRDARQEKEKNDDIRGASADAKRFLNTIKDQLESEKETVAELEKRLEEAKQAVAKTESKVKNAAADHKLAREKADALKDPDIESIEDELEKVEETNRVVRERIRIQNLEKEYQAKREEYRAIDGHLEELRAERQKAIQSADMPIEGLSVSEDGIELNGKPWVQLSSSQRLKASVAIAMRKNPNLRVIRVEDGSMLDDDSMGMLSSMAEENDFHIWIERVGEDENMTIVLSNGEIKE